MMNQPYTNFECNTILYADYYNVIHYMGIVSSTLLKTCDSFFQIRSFTFFPLAISSYLLNLENILIIICWEKFFPNKTLLNKQIQNATLHTAIDLPHFPSHKCYLLIHISWDSHSWGDLPRPNSLVQVFSELPFSSISLIPTQIIQLFLLYVNLCHSMCIPIK